MGTSALRITSPFCCNRPSPKRAKKPEKLGKCRSVTVKYILNTRRKKSKFFSHIERFVNDRHRPAHFSIHAPYAGATLLPSRCPGICNFNPHPHKGATSGDYLVNSRTAVVNPTAKACFCQSSHRCNRASSVPVQACPTVCAGLPVQTSPALACTAPHTGLLILVSCFPP